MKLLTTKQESLIVKLIIVFICACVYRSTGATIRLVDGSTSYEGRVEVYHNGRWGTVCDDGWSLNDAQVVCRQLGFGPAIAYKSGAFYGQGSGQIWLDEVRCVGTELTIKDCSHNGWGIEDCSHYEDAGVQCSALNVRLVDGPTSYEGRVEVYHSGRWGTVCDDGWSLNDAQVVCRQLGFGPAIAYKSGAFYGEGSGQIWLDEVRCVGTELTIEDCLHNGWGIEDCSHSEDAGVECSALDGYGNLRISGGGSSGALEFRLDNGTWGYVCSRGFDSDASGVACRQLGYTSGTNYPYSYNYYYGYAICDTYCYGYESRLADCSIEICSQYGYNCYYGAVVINCYDQSPSSGSSSSSDDDGNHVYPGIIGAVLLVFIIAGIVIIVIIIVIKKRKSIRRSQQTARIAVTTPPQASVVHYTYPSVTSQAPVSNHSYPTSVYTQQQTPQASTGNEAAMTSISPQAAAFYPYYHGAEHASAGGLTCNQSALPDGNKLAVNPPPYSACTGKHAPDGSTNNPSMLLPPDHASARSSSASVQVPPTTNS